MSEWNDKVIAEFRANGGRVGGPFTGAPMVLVHHRGRRTGKEGVAPMMYLLHETDEDTIYVFASNGGALKNPAWYYNLVASGHATVERGTDTYQVEVRELTGTERDQRYAEQVALYPGFAKYADEIAGARTIPVLELTRV